MVGPWRTKQICRRCEWCPELGCRCAHTYIPPQERHGIEREKQTMKDMQKEPDGRVRRSALCEYSVRLREVREIPNRHERREQRRELIYDEGTGFRPPGHVATYTSLAPLPPTALIPEAIEKLAEDSIMSNPLLPRLKHGPAYDGFPRSSVPSRTEYHSSRSPY